MNPRLFVTGVLALAAGLYIGRVIPQSEIRQLRKNITELEARAREQAMSPRMAMAGVESMLQISRDAKSGRAEPAETVAEPESAPVESIPDTNVVAVASAPDGTGRASRSNAIARAKEAWDLRRDIARRNFVERATLDPEQAAKFDVLVEAMNLRLGTTVDKWAAQIQEQDVFTAETGIRLMNEISEALVLTYDEMDRTLPAGWRDQAGPRFELVRFVDPEILTPLETLEPIMSRSPNMMEEDEEESGRAFNVGVDIQQPDQGQGNGP